MNVFIFLVVLQRQEEGVFGYSLGPFLVSSRVGSVCVYLKVQNLFLLLLLFSVGLEVTAS